MKTLKPADLPNLPVQVRSLVADGVYSLYEVGAVSPGSNPPHRYVLLTKSTEYYFLDAEGEPTVPPAEIRSIDDIDLTRPVMMTSNHTETRLNFDRRG